MVQVREQIQKQIRSLVIEQFEYAQEASRVQQINNDPTAGKHFTQAALECRIARNELLNLATNLGIGEEVYEFFENLMQECRDKAKTANAL